MANREINIENQISTDIIAPFFDWRRVLVTTLIGAFIGLLGPFGMNQLPAYVGMSYWMLTCLIGYGIYAPVIALCHRYLALRNSARWHGVALGAVIASAPMSLLICMVNRAFFGAQVDMWVQFVSIFPKVLLIGSFITAVSFLRQRIELQKQEIADVKQQHEQASYQPVEGFMENLPVAKRGKLLCLEMSDHYVKVYTDKGHHLVLMRFKDAMQVLANFPGMQTHRSWWVARDAIVDVRKEQRKLQLVLENDVVVPVSRTYAEQVKQAGFGS